MPSPFNPSIWYFAVSGNPTHVFSTGSASFVLLADSTYQTWLSIGNLPTPAASNDALFAVLYNLGGLNQAIADALFSAGGLTTFSLDIRDIFDAGFTLPGPIGNRGGRQTGVAALAGGAQAGATKLLASVCIMGTVTSPGDSVKMWHSAPGFSCILSNPTGNSVKLWASDVANPATSAVDVIDGASSVNVGAGKVVRLTCGFQGFWDTLMGTPAG